MSGQSFDIFMPVAIVIALAILMYVLVFFLTKILSPYKPNAQKSTPYECGELPVGSAWSSFNVRFYVVGLIFIIFDVESVLMFPVATIFNSFVKAGNGLFILIIFLSFISVLLEGIAYVWKKGDLDWVKSFQVNAKNGNKE